MSVIKGIALVSKIVGKRGRLKATEKATLTKVAKQNDMSVTELKNAVKKDKASVAGEGTASDKAVAKREGISVAELQKKRKAAKKKKKTPKKWTRSKKERAELARLTSQQRKENLGEQFKGAGMHGGRREQTVRAAPGRTGLQKPHIIESPSGRLKSKQILDTDDWTKTEKFRQARQPHADPQSQIAEAMGLKGKGSLPTSEEARALGLTVKKGGGIVVDAKFGKFIKALMRKAKKVVSPKKKPVVAKKTKSDLGKVGPKRKAYLQQKKLEHEEKYKELLKARKEKNAARRVSNAQKAITPKKKTEVAAGKALGLQKIKQSRPKPGAKRIHPLTKPKPGASPAKIKQWRIATSQAKTPTQRAADRRKFEEKAGITLSKKSLKQPGISPTKRKELETRLKQMKKDDPDMFKSFDFFPIDKSGKPAVKKKSGGPVVKAKFGSLIKTLKGIKKPKPTPKKKPVVTKKKPVKKTTGLRSKLQGRSAKDIEKSYSSFQIEDMLTKLKQAGTPDKTLVNRLNKIHRKHEAKFKAATQRQKAAERARIREIDAREALGLKKEKVMRKKEKDIPGLTIKRKKNWDDMTMEEKYAAEYPRTRRGKFAKQHPEPDPMRGAPKMPSTKKKRGKVPAHLKGPARKPGWWLSSDRKKGGTVIKAKKGSGKKTIGGSKKPKAKKIDPWLKGKGREEGWWLSSDRKKGGAIKRNKGGAVRGVGKAARGFGNAKYSKKLY